MIDIPRLYLGRVSPSDRLRYGHGTSPAAARKPVVVWNVTRRCNLSCVHCYSASDATPAEDELTTDEGRALVDDLARFGCPVILFSGGEPLLRPDLTELVRHAARAGARAVVSTNGTLLDAAKAAELKDAGAAYVGVSLDGLREMHDRFRGREGAFDLALAGIRACRDAGLKVGIRYTVTRENTGDVPGVFDLIEAESVPRACFYHLVRIGRGSALADQDLDHRETRRVVDLIVDKTAELIARDGVREVLTVDNHADGPYLYLRMLREGRPGAEEALELLRRSGGNASGSGIGCVSWDGTVYPDQFWRTRPLGNVRERPFSRTWTDLSDPAVAVLKEKWRHVKGRCAACRFLDACNGNLRARAEAATGDPWAPDPACYLSDEEIGIEPDSDGGSRLG